MSIWTHVAGVIRIDAFRMSAEEVPDFDLLIGRECLWKDPLSLWEERDAHPDDFLPMGSEGSLQKSVWINPDTSYLAAYTVMIFGDLRDYANPEKIIEWFKNKCGSIDNNPLFVVRQAVITADTECVKTVTWTYGEDMHEPTNVLIK